MTDAIVECARGWIGTRFHHQGRAKQTAAHKGGVDCLGLLMGVARELGLKDRRGCALLEADELHYSHYPDTVHLRARLCAVLRPVPIDQMQEGDVLLLTIEEQPQHLAIVSTLPTGLGMIHAYAQARGVVEHGLDSWWRSRIDSVFRVESA